MKLTLLFNKVLIITLFAIGILFIPIFKVSAVALIMHSIDDGSGGEYGSVTLNVNLDESSYIGAGMITASASAFVDTCSNTTSLVTIKAKMLNSSDSVIGVVQTILDETVQGSSDTGMMSTIFIAPSTAPSGQTGNYKIRFEATRKDPSTNEVLDTAIQDFPFTVPPTTVDVFINNSNVTPQTINAGTQTPIYWRYSNANHCTCTASKPIKFNSDTATPGTFCGESTVSSGLNNTIPSTIYNLYGVDSQTTFSVVCNNN